MKILKRVFIAAFFFTFVCCQNASANLGQVKIYKAAFPEEKPKCTNCHVDKIPKKEEGKPEEGEVVN